MKKKLLICAVVSSTIWCACQTQKTDKTSQSDTTAIVSTSNSADLPFTLAKNYFIKNTVDTLPNPKLTTRDEFEAVFGAATTMGENGKPTSIDFEKSFVIAVISPITDVQTDIKPISLRRDNTGKILLTYQKLLGEKQSYSTRPNFAIIVDRKETGEVVLKEQNN